MVVAYELGKTLEEIYHMPLEELADWLAFFKVREKKAEQAKRNQVVRSR